MEYEESYINEMRPEQVALSKENDCVFIPITGLELGKFRLSYFKKPAQVNVMWIDHVRILGSSFVFCF